MLKRYAIWDKKSDIITPVGEVLSAEQWMQRYPVAGIPTITVVCSSGEINGGLFGTLGQMVKMYENDACDFCACSTDEEKLEAIEASEDAMNQPSSEVSAEERIPGALEFQALTYLPDSEE